MLVGLAQSRTLGLGALAAAFDIAPETLRLIRLQYEHEGLRAIVDRRPNLRGRTPKVDDKKRARMESLFDAGKTIAQVVAIVGKKWDIRHSTVGAIRKQWADRKAAPETPKPASTVAMTPPTVSIEPPPVAAQMRLPGFTNSNDIAAPTRDQHGDELETSPRSGRGVQHLGSWLLLSLVHRLGLYDCAARLREDSVGSVSLRVALDALIAAFAIGEHTAEGVRRIATPTAPLLLRTRRAPSSAWVRATLGNFADVDSQRGGRLMLHMLGHYLADDDRVTRDGAPYVVYIDNHLRPYTGKRTVRRGWRMQDKRVRPGVSDYWLHDEDGRPLYRIDSPSHDSLVHWLAPMARPVYLAAPDGLRVLFAFDRAGAFPSAMSDLLDAGIEGVTYERKPYPIIANDAFFTESVVIDGETFLLGETPITHRRARLPLRRIVVRDERGRQVNLLSTSKLPAQRLLEIMFGRWVQENAFKHGVERWGINQLDHRAVEPVPAGTVVPNPARRRLDHAIRLVSHEEGAVRIALAAHDLTANDRARLDAKLHDLVMRREDLHSQRARVPKKAPVEETELAGKLVRHLGDYKTLIDTVRVACANAESELAALIAPQLDKPAEAKKLLATIFASPGRLRVGPRSISVQLAPAASRAERRAFASLLRTASAMRLALPGDARPLSFRLQT